MNFYEKFVKKPLKNCLPGFESTSRKAREDRKLRYDRPSSELVRIVGDRVRGVGLQGREQRATWRGGCEGDVHAAEESGQSSVARTELIHRRYLAENGQSFKTSENLCSALIQIFKF